VLPAAVLISGRAAFTVQARGPEYTDRSSRAAHGAEPSMIALQKSASKAALTPERVARLCRLARLLGAGPKTRASLLRSLKVDTRGFYRDFEKMRAFGVAMEMREGRYILKQTVAEALARLPFPDPGLSVQEALMLAKGKTLAHRKLRMRIEEFLGKSIG
jgi:hypothetical protein